MLEDFESVSVLNFFDLKIDCRYLSSKPKLYSKKYLMPSTSQYLYDQNFAKIYFGWDKEGIYFHFQIRHPHTKENKLDFRRAESIEIFLDTRNLKTKGYITKFCHHFVFFTDSAKEVTRFRISDMHKLCNPKDLKVSSKLSKNSYFSDLFIPFDCLYGFDSSTNQTIGFNYRINRYQDSCMDFSSSSYENNLDRNPYLWASVNLIK